MLTCSVAVFYGNSMETEHEQVDLSFRIADPLMADVPRVIADPRRPPAAFRRRCEEQRARIETAQYVDHCTHLYMYEEQGML